MFLHLLRGVGTATRAFVESRQLIMRRRMFRLELHDGFELSDGIRHMAEFIVRQTELKIQRGDGGIEALGLLQSLDRRLGLVEPQMCAQMIVVSGYCRAASEMWPASLMRGCGAGSQLVCPA